MNDLRRRAAWGPWALLLVFGAGCRGTSGAARADAGASPASSATRPAAAPAAEIAAEAAGPAIPVHELGAWASSDVYEIKVDEVKFCVKPTEKDAGSASRVIGAKVHIKSNTGEFFVDPRHGALRSGGVLFQGKGTPAFQDCAPALKSGSLRKDQEVSGFILFDLPEAWPNLVLDYQPVRWGGAGLLRVAVPNLSNAP